MSNKAFSELKAALTIGLVVFLAALLGIVSKSSSIAGFWPANAILLGLLLRAPRFSTPAGWISACAGLVLASLAAGNSLPASLALNASNIISVATAYLLYRRHKEDILYLRRGRAISVLLANALLAGLAAGAIAALIVPAILHDASWRGGLSRGIVEVVNYLTILPIVLSAPSFSWRWLDRRRYQALNIKLRNGLPLLALLLSCAMSMFISRPTALLFPVPVLLWCAVSYSVFTTALLSLAFGIWIEMLLLIGTTSPGLSTSSIDHGLSIRLFVSLLALALITVAATMAARDELMRRLQDIASRDQLTGLLNRHAFRERCNAVLNELRSNQKPACLLIINIDHFKSINDKYGYSAGDRALGSFSRIVSGCLRGSDVFGRLGGEEFAVLLPECSGSDAQMVAERIRNRIADTALDLGEGLETVMTASIGIATATAAGNDIESLLLAADSALYRAKKSGRNRVESEFS